MIYLTDAFDKTKNNASYEDIVKAYSILSLGKTINSKPVSIIKKSISLFTDFELELEIYKRTIILQDWGSCEYDGPGGPGEILRIRVKEGSLLKLFNKIINALNNNNLEELVLILKSLPKPDTNH